MHRPILAGLFALVLVVSAVGVSGSVLTADSAEDPGAMAQPSIDAEAIDTDGFESTTFELTVHENGDATWTSRYERQLSPGEREEFEAFAEEFEEDDEDELYVRFTEQAHALTDRGADHTDREMEAVDFNRSAGVDYRPNRMGYVELSFTWTGFAPTDGDGTITVGDVFAGGLYIEDDQSLVIKAGDGLTFVATQPTGQYSGPSIEDADSVSWSGQHDFPPNQPRVVLEPVDGGGGEPAATWLVAAAVLALALGGGFVWYRGRPTTTDDTPPTETADPAAADSSAAPDSIDDEELLSDEDRVVALIRENGGRMKQVDIVDETGWSKSKVSMLLSEMESDGTISKLRVGRENIISLDGHEPEAARSPFEN